MNKWKLYGQSGASFLIAGHSHACAYLDAVNAAPLDSNLRKFSTLYPAAPADGPPGDLNYWNVPERKTLDTLACPTFSGHEIVDIRRFVCFRYEVFHTQPE